MFVVIWRTLFLYVFIVASLRFMGKRQLGELQPSELVITMLISNIAAVPIENLEVSLLNGVLSIALLICLEVLSAGLALKSRTARRIIQGNPACIIRDGQIDQNKMEQLRYSLDDLVEQLRAGGVFNLSEVMLAMVEPTGSLSVYLKSPHRPLTPTDMNLELAETPPQYMVVADGELCEDNLQAAGVTKERVEKILRRKGYTPKQIYFMSCAGDKDFYIVPKTNAKKASNGSRV